MDEQVSRYLDLVAKSMDQMPRYMIPTPDGEPYLERFVLQENLGSNGLTKDKTYLHIIWASDDDRDPHDHPFDFSSLIIHGSYVERSHARWCPSCSGLVKKDLVACSECGSVLQAREYEVRKFSPGQQNVKKAHQLHRLELVDGPVVTLVKRGPKLREWGFMTNDGWEGHGSYIARKFPNARPTEVD